MDVLTLSRIQFAITTVYHFLFAPLMLGLSLLIALMETAYVRAGNDTYKCIAQFWGRLFLINFTLGIVTGIVQEFQFGMNWSTYSRFVGDIFDAPLAVEALLASHYLLPSREESTSAREENSHVHFEPSFCHA